MTSRSILSAVLAIVLLGLAAAPLAAAAESCIYARGLGTVCRDLTLRESCVWASEAPTNTGIGAAQKQCVSYDQVNGVTIVCAKTVAGTTLRLGDHGVSSTQCVATYEWNTAQCVMAWGEVDNVAWQFAEPVCAVEPIPLRA